MWEMSIQGGREECELVDCGGGRLKWSQAEDVPGLSPAAVVWFQDAIMVCAVTPELV